MNCHVDVNKRKLLFHLAPNVLNRQLDVDHSNRFWAVDITYVWTLEGWFTILIGAASMLVTLIGT